MSADRLNFEHLARLLLRGHDIGRIKYFTARVTDRPDDPTQSQRQDTYLRAPATLPLVEVHEGHFRTRKKMVRLVNPLPSGKMFEKALITEEKGTDVALGAHLVWDAAHELIDSALILSNDSDLQVPVDMAMSVGVRVIVTNPHRHVDQAPHLHGHETRNLRRAHLEASQLPAEVLDSNGRRIVRPPRWDP